MKSATVRAACLMILTLCAGTAVACAAPLFTAGHFKAFRFQPLTEKEHLTYTLGGSDGRTMSLYAQSSPGSERRLIATWANTYPPGELQFTRVRNSCFFVEYNENSGKDSLWFLNGEKGTVEYLMQVERGYQSTADGKYLVYDNMWEGPKHTVITLYDVPEKKVVKTFIWPVKYVAGAYLAYKRAQTGENIRILMGVEVFALAEGVLNIEKRTVIVFWHKSYNDAGTYNSRTW